MTRGVFKTARVEFENLKFEKFMERRNRINMIVTEKTTIGDLCQAEEFKPFSDYFFSIMTEETWNTALGQYGFEKCGFVNALEKIRELCGRTRAGENFIYHVYREDERNAEPDKEKVKLIHMPGEAGKPYVLVCPGGAYARQWGIIEGLAVGERLNRLGYTAFVLFYRTMMKPPFTEALFPKPLEDLERAVQWIGEHSDELKVLKENYAVAGFSAGAHLAAEWGTANCGWKACEAVRPAALLLGYPSISTDIFCDFLENAEGIAYSSANDYLTRIGGPGYTREELRKYSVDLHLDQNCPPVYLVACQDDPTVPVLCSYRMIEVMDKLQIPYEANIAAHGGHSFGVGDGTEVDGWLDQAVRFWQNHCNF